MRVKHLIETTKTAIVHELRTGTDADQRWWVELLLATFIIDADIVAQGRR